MLTITQCSTVDVYKHTVHYMFIQSCGYQKKWVESRKYSCSWFHPKHLIQTPEANQPPMGVFKHELCLSPHLISKTSNHNECCTIDYQSWNHCTRTTNALFCSCFYEVGTLYIMSSADTSLMNGRRLAMERWKCNLIVGCRLLIHLYL